jgi:hypothetical protein
MAQLASARMSKRLHTGFRRSSFGAQCHVSSFLLLSVCSGEAANWVWWAPSVPKSRKLQTASRVTTRLAFLESSNFHQLSLSFLSTSTASQQYVHSLTAALARHSPTYLLATTRDNHSNMLLSILFGFLLGLVSAIPTISTKGSKFFTSDGNQFFLKGMLVDTSALPHHSWLISTTGVAYQLLPEDPLIDNTQCTLDANLMKTLGANSIRVYHVDPQAEHDDCMKTFADAGIYIWLDLDTFNSYIQGPGMSAPQWNETQYKAYQEVMDAFHNYDNLGGFFVGNEVLTSPDTDVAAPFVKAAARDMKAYRDGKWQIPKSMHQQSWQFSEKDYRKIPVGYTAADVATLRPMLQNYLACGEDTSEAVDFYGLNAYEWYVASIHITHSHHN